MYKLKNTNRGFISYIVLILVALIALKYFFNFDIVAYLKSQQAHDFVAKILTLIGKLQVWLKIALDWMINFVKSIF